MPRKTELLISSRFVPFHFHFQTYTLPSKVLTDLTVKLIWMGRVGSDDDDYDDDDSGGVGDDDDLPSRN